MTYNTTIKVQTKTLVDSSNTLYTMEYDNNDNTVVVQSDRAISGGYAVIGQYCMDNGLGYTIPTPIVDSAMEMLAIDEERKSALDHIIDTIVDAKRARV